MTGEAFHDRRRVTWQEIAPHLQYGALITGSFVVAWSWDLVLYGASHAAAGENPRQDQIGFGNARAPKFAVLLLGQYLVVCGAAAALSHFVKERWPRPWGPTAAVVMAVEFLPSPYFAGKLMAWLGQFSGLGAVPRGLLNLAVTWAAAALAHGLPSYLGTRLDARLGRFTPVVQNTLGFGLGIAWNAFLGQLLLGPQRRGNDNDGDGDDNDNGIDIVQLIGLGGYLAVVLLLALRLAAHPKRDNGSSSNSSASTLWDRQIDLLSFAMQVVCAFTLVAFLDAFTHASWYGAIEAMLLLLALSAVLNATVAGVDVDALRQQALQRGGGNNVSGSIIQAPRGPALCLFFCPCVWCCCPWVPLLVLLAGNASNNAVREDWFQLIAMVTGLSASIEASNCMTALMDAAAGSFCTAKHCDAPWLFVLLQILVAMGTTVVLLPCLSPLCKDDDKEDYSPPDENATSGERQGLLV